MCFRIGHFSHVQSGASIGEDCSFVQNANISYNVKIAEGVKNPNNAVVYEGVG